jgi:hypothetical protein
VREVERDIRAKYPAAEFIELEPASKDTTAFAIDGHRSASGYDVTAFTWFFCRPDDLEGESVLSQLRLLSPHSESVRGQRRMSLVTT